MSAAPATPYLAVDGERLARNLARVHGAAADLGVRLRPHTKTHKSPVLARLQLEAGAQGITVATVGEAEVFVGAGFDDVLVAYPLFVDAERGRRLRTLAERARIVVGVDSVDGVRRVAAHAPDVAVHVEVDSGHHRTGVLPHEAATVAGAAAEAGLEIAGVFTFPGHSYAPGAGPSAAVAEAEALAAAADALAAAGLPCPVRSGGSTPSLATSLAQGPGAVGSALPDELRPGVYLLGDAQQWELGHHEPDDIALTCVATVVSHAGGRLVLDSGGKVLGADRAPHATGWGRLPAHPDARVVLLSEHHAVVDLGGGPLPAVGSRVEVAPNHVCAAINLVDTIWVDGAPLPVEARGRNS
ncbi:alanine racemase [Nocardioides sp. CPCC 205120]|uniref:alanine racemase n=1 Tax=Nocardioides sp. CPCC 205120 TaxID=3406462 RepID=UPI003B512157